MQDPASGYAHRAYAGALADLGPVRALPRSGGSVIVRDIGASGHRDAMGPYPIFSCADWDGLAEDLRGLADELVAVSLVVDPFGGWTTDTLRRCFPDVLRHFKDHYVVELGPDPLARAHPHLRRNIARARRELEVEVVADPIGFADEWEALYEQLIARHGIRGVAAFSRRSLTAQLAVPGLVALRAVADGVTVGASLWYEQGDVAYYHLAAYDRTGYERRASFALFASAFELFAQRGLRWISLGAGAGAAGDPDDGLSRFKRGWSTATRPAWFGGRVLRREVYDRLAGAGNGEWFPAYRSGEFA
jgi:PAS domain-containing protein